MIEIALIALVGFGVMYVFADIFGLSDSAWNYGLMSLALILVGIGAPYAILKIGMPPEIPKPDTSEKKIQLEKDENG